MREVMEKAAGVGAHMWDERGNREWKVVWLMFVDDIILFADSEQKLVKELKSNLSDMGEVTHRLNKSIKQTLSFDASYLADSIWDRLSKLADHTVLELSEFTEDLRQHMAIDATTYSQQQQNWFSDVMQWQGDYETALKKLEKVRAEVRKQMRDTTIFSKAILKDKPDNDQANQEKHDYLSQRNQDIVRAVNELNDKVMGGTSND